MSRRRSPIPVAALVLLAVILVACGGNAAPALSTRVPPAITTPAAASANTASPAAVPPPAETTTAPAVAPTTAPTEVPVATVVATEVPTSAPAASPVETTGPTGDAIDVIANAMQSMMQQKGIRANMITDTGTGKTITNTIEMAIPNRVHMKTYNGSEIIILRGESGAQSQVFMKNQSGKWSQMPAQFADTMAQIANPFDSSWVDELRKSTTTTPIMFAGIDMVDGKPAWVYDFTSTTKIGDGNSVSAATKLWVDVSNKLPLKLESVSDSLVKSAPKAKTTILYEYDPNIKIEPPAM